MTLDNEANIPWMIVEIMLFLWSKGKVPSMFSMFSPEFCKEVITLNALYIQQFSGCEFSWQSKQEANSGLF